MRLRGGLAVLVVALSACSMLQRRTDGLASIRVRVTDDYGAGMERVPVRIEGFGAGSAEARGEQETNHDGDAVFDRLTTGTYTIRIFPPVSYGGGASVTRSVAVIPNANKRVNVRLARGINSTPKVFPGIRSTL